MKPLNHATLAAMMLASPALAQPVIAPLPATQNFLSPSFVTDAGVWAGHELIQGWPLAVHSSPQHGYQRIGALLSDVGTFFAGSGDGESVILTTYNPDDGRTYHLWTTDGGLQPIPFLRPQGLDMYVPAAISHDGDKIAGKFFVAGPCIADAVGPDLCVPDLGPGGLPTIEFMSSDGSVVFGTHPTSDFLWRPATGQILRFSAAPRNATEATRRVMSDDGRAVLGIYRTSAARGMFRWSISRGVTLVPEAAPGLHMDPTSMTRSGSIAVGRLYAGQAARGSGVWTYTGGARPFAEYLAQAGVATPGWTDLIVLGISPDGTRMVGEGHLNGVPRGWMISGLPAARSCAGDFNGDQFFDWVDYAGYTGAFERGMDSADLNADGMIDFFDYADFVEAFETGC